MELREELKQKQIINFEDIGFTVVAYPFSHYVECNIYKIRGKNDNNELLYDDKDNRYHNPQTTDLEKAEIFLYGEVNWDGCSNWMSDDCKQGMYIHFCTPEEILNAGAVLYRCYHLTKELCGSWDVNLPLS